MTILHSRGSYDVKTTTIERALSSFPAGSYLITDDNVDALYGALVDKSIPKIAVPAGEKSKSSTCPICRVHPLPR